MGIRIKRKIILVCFIASLLILAFICGIILYYYSHQSAIKSVIEKSISRSTGTTVTIKHLSYSLKPMRIRAKGIIIKLVKTLQRPQLDIRDIRADIALEGPFGHKSLTVKSIMIDGFSLNISEKMSLPKIVQHEKSLSFFNRLLKKMIAFFFFRDIIWQTAEIVNGDISGRLGDQMVQIGGIQAKLDPDHLLTISCSTQIQWPLKKMILTAPHIQIATDHGISLVDPEIRFSLKAQKATFQSPVVNAKSLEVTAKLIYNHKHKNLRFDPMDLDIEGVILKKESERKSILSKVQLNAAGHFDLQGSKLNFARFFLAASDILQLRGKSHVDFGAQPVMEFILLDGQTSPSKLLPLLPDDVTVMLSPFTFSGPISFHGRIDGLKELEIWSWHGDLQAQLKQNQFSYTTGNIRLNSRVAGTIRAEGRFPDIRISGRIEGDKTILSGGGIELKPFKVSLSLTGKHPAYLIKDFTVHIPRAKVGTGGKYILIDDIHAYGRKGSMDGEKRSLFLPEIRLNSSLLKNLQLSLRVDGEQAIITLHGKQTHLIESALSLNLLPSGWQLSGLDSIQIKAILKDEGYWSFTSKLGFWELDFQNWDSSCMGEKISINAEMNGKINIKRASITANTSIEVHGGEILYDRFYLDLNKNTLFSSFEGRYDISNKFLQLSHLKLGLKDILMLDARGTLLQRMQDYRTRFFVSIPKISLKPVFQHFLLEPFQTERPYLAALNIGGAISAELELTGDGSDWMLLGHFMWHSGELSSDTDGFSFSGIDLDLPVWFQTHKGKSGQETVKGKLSIQYMTLPLLPKQALTLQLDAGSNLLSVRSPTILRAPGGEIRLGPVVCKDLFISRPSIETSLALNSIDLTPFLSEIWSRPIQGTIEGTLESIHFAGDTLSSRGEIKAKVFGGELIFSEFYASGIVTSVPVFKLNARFNDLSLAKLTKGTSFGKIEGILKGHIKDLEIAFGQPQRFNLLLETVKKKGVPQKISVRAVENIARIGGGQSPFTGISGVFSSFFRELPYKKIGVRASLENDVFRINGTIKEGGTEYLVKRGVFSGVNIINQNPDNRISFKDMVKRIKRVTASGRSPVLK